MIRPYLLILSAMLFACGDSGSSPACETNDDCPGTMVCSAAGVCEAPPPQPDGSPCTLDSECISGACADLGQGKVCATVCSSTDDCSDDNSCSLRKLGDATASRLALICAPQQGAKFTGEACTADTDCRSNICEEGTCTEPCGSCPTPFECSPTTFARDGESLEHGRCTSSRTETLSLGGTSVTDGADQPLTFEIPPGVKSFAVYALSDDQQLVGIARLNDPMGTEIANLEGGAPIKNIPFVSIGTLLVPGTDDPTAAVKAGTYEVWPQTYDPAAQSLTPTAGTITEVAVVYRRSQQPGGVFDLALHFAPATGLTAATADTDVYMQAVLNQLNSLVQRIFGVGIGAVTFHDLTAAEDDIENVEEAQAIRMANAKAGPNGHSINIFVVDNVQFGSVASAPGLPSAPFVFNSTMSGIVSERVDPAGPMAQLLAHEIGHFWGLFHTSEQSGGHDVLSDTPECASGTNIQNCPDKLNIMFPFHLQVQGAKEASPSQLDIVARSPWLYENVFARVCANSVAGVLLDRDFASGDTGAGSSELSASCGGDNLNERAHLLRLGEDLASLKIDVLADNFAPVVYIYKDSCPAQALVACETGDAGTELSVTVPTPLAGEYFIVVDGGSGRYQLSVTRTPF